MRDKIIKKYISVLDKIITDYESTKTEKRGRKNKFDNVFYLKRMMNICLYNSSWEHLNFEDTYHYSTIKKKFYKWRDLGFFNYAHTIIFNEYKKNRTFKNMFVDSTIIQNYNGCDKAYIDYYYKIVSKKQMKISVICDNNKIPLIWELSKPQKADIKGCINLIPKLNVNLKKKSCVIGDKGYIVKKKYYRNKNKNIKIVSNTKKNQLIQNTEKEKKLLKNRYLIENSFGSIKNSYKRIRHIYDRNIENYETFFIMAVTCQIIRVLEKSENK